MLNVEVRSHRPYLRASAGGQKLFLMLKLLPAPEAASARPRVSLAVVVDTSGSMREPAPGFFARQRSDQCIVRHGVFAAVGRGFQIAGCQDNARHDYSGGRLSTHTSRRLR